MATLADFFSLPIGGYGAKPNPYLKSESGRPVYETPLGVTFEIQPQAKSEDAKKRAIVDALVSGQKKSPFYGPAQAEMDVQRQGAEATLGGILPGLLDGVLQGVQAPGRAARGEPVTYGDVWSTALDYGALAAPAGKPAGAIGGGGIRAYHGSPHDFDRFDLSKIGTGEGAQAYGHGLYFAENEAVAREYKKALGGKGKIDAINARLSQIARERDEVKKGGFGPAWPDWEKKKARYTELGAEYDDLMEKRANLGHMYEVNINADPADFLDWDAPLSEQPAGQRIISDFDARRQEILAGLPEIDGSISPVEYDAQYGGALSEAARFRIKPEWTGAQLYESSRLVPGDYRNPVAASETLKSQGIPGIKYLDAGSRGAGDGSRNFVVFDDRLIEIVRKYGIAGAAAMLGISAAELQAQMGGASAAPSADDLRSYLNELN